MQSQNTRLYCKAQRWQNSARMIGLSPEQFQPVGVWQSLREDGKARSCSTGKVARNDTRVIRSQPPAVPLHWRGRRGSESGACAATERPISHWPRPHGRAGEETQTRTDNSNPGRFSEAPRDRQQTIFRATPCAPCSSAPRGKSRSGGCNKRVAVVGGGGVRGGELPRVGERWRSGMEKLARQGRGTCGKPENAQG